MLETHSDNHFLHYSHTNSYFLMEVKGHKNCESDWPASMNAQFGYFKYCKAVLFHRD